MKPLRIALLLAATLVFSACEFGPFAVQTLDLPAYATLTPTDTYFASDDQWYLSAIRAPEAWGLYDALRRDALVGADIRTVQVAVIDSGVVAGHPDLSAVISDRSIDLVGSAAAWTPGGVDSTVPGLEHGTHVAGLIAGIGGNGIGIAGAAYNGYAVPVAEVISVRALEDRSGTLDDLTEAISVAAGGATFNQLSLDEPVSVLNMSLGVRASALTTAARVLLVSVAQNAAAADILMIAAAGNDGASNSVDYPARLDEVIAVGSVDRPVGTVWSRSTFSDQGAQLELVAPGATDSIGDPNTGLISTYPGGYAFSTGTSMATPLVAGVAALLRNANPRLTASEVRTILAETAIDVGPAGRDAEYGWGVVNAEAALAMAISRPFGRVESRSVAPLTAEAIAETIQRSPEGPYSWDPTGFRRLIVYVDEVASISLIERETGLTLSPVAVLPLGVAVAANVPADRDGAELISQIHLLPGVVLVTQDVVLTAR